MLKMIRQDRINTLKNEVGKEICFAGAPELFRMKKDVFFRMII